MRSDKGISMITLAVTIIVMIIIAGIAIRGSKEMIDESGSAKISANEEADDDIIRSLITFVEIGEESKQGVQLIDGALVVLDDSGDEFGTGYYLIPGGDAETIKKIQEETDYTNLRKYKTLTATYIVNYITGEFHRIEDIKFK